MNYPFLYSAFQVSEVQPGFASRYRVSGLYFIKGCKPLYLTTDAPPGAEDFYWRVDALCALGSQLL